MESEEDGVESRPIPDERRSPLSNAESAFFAFAFVVAAVFVSVAVETVVRATEPLPFWDQWERLTPSEILTDVFALHNEHRIAVPRVLYAMDAAWFGGRHRVESVAVVAMTLAHVLLLGRLGAVRPGDRRSAMLATCLPACLLFSLRAWEIFVWGFEVPFVLVYLAATAAFALVADARARASTLALAIVCILLATFSLANGLLVGPLAIVLSVLARRPRPQVAVVAVVSALLIVMYLRGYSSPVGHARPVDSFLAHPLRVLLYACVYVGSPISRHHAVAPVVGALGISGAAFSAVRLFRLRSTLAPERFVLPFVAYFALATAFVTALGRSNFEIGQASSSRYQGAALVFWAALLLHAIREAWSVRPQLGRRFVALACAVVTCLLVTEWPSRRRAFVHDAYLRVAEAALLAEADDVEALSSVYPDPSHVVERAEVLRRHRLSIYSEPWSRWLGTSLRLHTRRNDSACRGAILHVTPRRAVAGRSLRVDGWIENVHGASPTEHVVIVDDAGRVVGYAFSGFSRRRSERVSVVPHDARRFIGFVGARATAGARLRAYSLLDGDAVACELGGELVSTTD